MTDRQTPPSPMLARAAGGGGSSRAVRKPLLPSDSTPDSAAEAILALLSKEHFRGARSMAVEAVARFPGNARVQDLWSIFDTRGKAKMGTGGPGPKRTKEFAFLRDPPEWAYGKWVALIEGQAVAIADTLAEVMESLESKTFDRLPLVHRIG